MTRILKSVLLWMLALVITLTMLVYQGLTGPTYPVSGETVIAGQTIEYELERSHARVDDPRFGMDQVVQIPVSSPEIGGVLYWKRLGVEEPFREVVMERVAADTLMARLPAQPPAGKLVYHIELSVADGEAVSIPGNDGTVTIRFKDPEPMGILLPHIFCMFLALFFGVRTLIMVLMGENFRMTTWLTLGFLFAGGMILGPMLQNAAFGDYWTGWPFGGDVTDNKLALAFLAWIVAAWRVSVVEDPRRTRVYVVIACLILFSVFLIPHSLGGSTFNYETGNVDTGL